MTRPVCKRCGGSGMEPRDPVVQGAEMRATRVRIGLGLRELARIGDMSPAYLSDLERGRRTWTGPAAQRIERYLRRRTAWRIA